MRLFVTGGAGFIGSNFARHVLATSDDHVLGMAALRNSYTAHTIFPRLYGSMSSLGQRTSFSYGNAQYDYRLQSLDGEALTISIGVPTSIVLCSWQRL